MSSTAKKYQELNKILYVWNGGDPKLWYQWPQKNIDLLVNFCKVHGFTEVNIFVGSSADLTNGWMRGNIDQYKVLFQALSSANISIYTLFYDNDDPNDIPVPNTPIADNYKNLIDTLLNLKKSPEYSGIKGISYDQEPYNSAVYPNFQSRVCNIVDYAHQKGIGFGMALKMHWLTISSIGKQFLSKMNQPNDRPILMDYFPWQPQNNSVENQLAYQNICEKYVDPLFQESYGSAKINIALETETDAFSGGLPVNAFSGDGKIEGLSPNDFWLTVVNLEAKYNSSVNFGMIVVHQYGNSPKGVGYFNAMYQADPFTWVDSPPATLAINPSGRRR